MDGRDFDQLLASCREEMSQVRNSLVRRLRLEHNDLWEAIRILVGRPNDHLGVLEMASETFRIAEDNQSGSAHGIFSKAMIDAIEEEICRQTVDAPERRAIVYAVGGAMGDEPRPIEKVLEGASKVRAFLVNSRDSDSRTNQFSSVTRLMVDDGNGLIHHHRLLLVLGERLSYALMAQKADESSFFGFHSNDRYLVESLIAKLQDYYNFQRQY